jgi:type I restriction enzyme S subunit
METAELSTVPITENQLPDGWMRAEFGRLIIERKKSTLKVSDANKFGSYPFFTSGDSVLKHTDTIIEGANIYLATGGVANIKFFEGKASYSTDTYTITTINEVEATFLYYNLLNFIEYINANYFQGSGLKHLQKKDLKKHYILLPQSLYEQRQIAAILTKIDEAIAQTEALIAKYNRLKTGLMQNLLSHGIDEQGRIRSETTHAFKDSPLGRIPVEWEVEKLSKLAEITAGVTLGKEHAESGSIELPYLRVANVQDGYLDLSDIKYIRVPISQVSRYKLEIGDVLMNEGGDFDKLGRGAVWQGQIDNCIHQNHVFKVRLNQKEMLPEFLSLFSSSSFGKSFFILSSKQSTNLASINKNQLSEFPILKPSIEEQISILETINRQSNLILEMDKHLQKLKSLKTGLMQDLLSGRVRVKQAAEK